MVKKTSISPLFSFLLCLVVAVAIDYAPFIKRYFNWHDAFFHELSHGLAALATGGSVTKLTLAWNGSGALYHMGSKLAALVSFSGYAGAVLWGIVIYIVASNAFRLSQKWALVLAVLVGIVAALWVRNFVSLCICLVLIAGFLVLWHYGQWLLTQLWLQVVGLYLIVQGGRQAWWLMTNSVSQKNDGQTLASATGLPASVWAFVWLGISLLALVFLLRRAARR